MDSDDRAVVTNQSRCKAWFLISHFLDCSLCMPCIYCELLIFVLVFLSINSNKFFPQFNVDRANAEEFFEVYRGVVTEYPVSIHTTLLCHHSKYLHHSCITQLLPFVCQSTKTVWSFVRMWRSEEKITDLSVTTCFSNSEELTLSVCFPLEWKTNKNQCSFLLTRFGNAAHSSCSLLLNICIWLRHDLSFKCISLPPCRIWWLSCALGPAWS